MREIRAKCVNSDALVQGQIFRHLSKQTIFPAFLAEDFLPELNGVSIEDEVETGGMGKPGFAFHFILKLTGAPAGIAGEEFDFSGGRKGFTEVHQSIERMT